MMVHAARSLALGLGLLACGQAPARIQRTLVPPSHASTLDQKSPYLKAHLRTGHVYVLDSWQVDSSGTLVTGRGSLLTPSRHIQSQGDVRLPVDSVALFETNLLQRGSSRVTALSVMTGITAAVTTFCLTNTKSCFGSCPTFYVADGSGHYLHAEGFSASIAPALEAIDIDALHRARVNSRDFRVHLRNEALETHVIRHADILALRRPAGGRVLLTPDGQFRASARMQRPTRCHSTRGDCLGAVSEFDGHERTSLADSFDLATQETIELEFEGAPPGEVGLVISSRQSLMSTYLIYQMLAYLGTNASEALASLATGGPAAVELAGGIARMLGRIDVLVPDSAEGWVPVGSAGETGPLAPDTKVVPLPPRDGESVRVRLRFTQGLWRLDYLALAPLGEPLAPVRIHPTRMLRGDRQDPAALRALADTGTPLVTLPGDSYDIWYRLPPQPEEYELFLESRGYYLEWMRQEWLAEENLPAAAQILLDPAAALRSLAPAFKRQEPEMERLFWNSRYAVQ